MNTNKHIYYNPNPDGNRVGDCTVRALCRATGKSWDEVYTGLSAYGFEFKDMPSADKIWGAYLEDHGFKAYMIDKHGKRRYTVTDFCEDNPEGTYILAIGGHVVCVVDGYFYDSWDSGNETPLYYWKR